MSMLYLFNLAATRAVRLVGLSTSVSSRVRTFQVAKRYAHFLVLRVVVPIVTSLGSDSSTKTDAEED